ncbi:MAG: DUF1403 family protein [Paracoccaceae bacterium]
MTYAAQHFDPAPETNLVVPSWISNARAQTSEDVVFLSGAMLGELDRVAGYPGLPRPLWRDRLALWATEEAMQIAGRPERMADLRDEVHLARPGDTLGPGGVVFADWRRAVRTRLKPTRGQMPMIAASETLEAALDADMQDDAAALRAADTALARAMGWPHMVPLLALGLAQRDLRKRGAALRHACGQAVIAAGPRAVHLAQDLTRRAARLQAVAPKLRAKGAGAAVTLFLSEDALSPAVALSPIIRGSANRMTGRSARRLCDRLVDLGVVRELTGRDTFRLYGL